MDRKRRISGWILTAAMTTLLYGCSHDVTDFGESGTEKGCMADITISVSSLSYASKAIPPQESRISDISLMVFGPMGEIERYIRTERDKTPDFGHVDMKMELLKGVEYTFCACINFGYPVRADSIDDIDDLVYHMTYPDEYQEGMPMYARLDGVKITHDCTIDLYLKRLMAKICLKMDRSRLNEDVNMEVTAVRIGNCPRRIKVFSTNSVSSQDECFRSGFSHENEECSALNQMVYDGLSEEVSLYMLENMQGRFGPADITDDSQKVFEAGDPRVQLCSYIEMEIEYTSGTVCSASGPLIYRFYLGEDINSLDVERNSLYRITVCPSGDGLSDIGWRVDKSGLSERREPYISAFPSDYIRGDVGDVIHIWCEFYPPDAPFDAGEEYMIEDKARGIYDYVIDEDGKGATLTLTGPGSGLIYMEAGEPVNDAALFVIEVNLPDVT
ncbi:MAG: DUF4906 domain-containing protein [Bacteroidales bacterium]|nr:DUF4906 domain-containing protein [Bacteroidales bacterium]